MADKDTSATIGPTDNRLHLVRANLFALLLWPTLCVLAIAAVWVLVQAKIDRDRAELRRSAFRDAGALSKSYTEQLMRSLEQIDQVTLSLKFYWNKSGGRLSLEEQVEAGLFPQSLRLNVGITDSHGMMLTNTMPGAMPKDIVGRAYFKAAQNERSDNMQIEEPVRGKLSGRTVVPFVRRLETAGGAFDGVIVVGVDSTYLAAFRDTSSLSAYDFLSVRTLQGTVLVAKVGAGLGAQTSMFVNKPEFATPDGVQEMPGTAFVDGKPRIIAWSRLGNYPLMSMVGLSETDYFANYEKTSANYRHFATAGSLLLLLVGFAAAGFFYRLAWRKQQAEEVKDTYRLAVDGAREGFYMVRALYDGKKQVADFLIEDCNERGAQMVGSSRDELVGARYSDLYQGEHAEYVLNIFRNAMETGFYEDEFKVSTQSPVQGEWMHRRLVRSGPGLAMTLRDISDTKKHEEQLWKMANADALTSLPNRHWMMSYLPTALERARVDKLTLAVLFLDLDDFKTINDSMGHQAGDELLQAAGARLKAVLRLHDHAVRLGGDEFTIIMEKCGSEADIVHVAERVIHTLAEPFSFSGGAGHAIGVSVGISIFPSDGQDAEALLKLADEAMYAAKSSGKGQYRFYSGLAKGG
ncbi:diguanylate cyclase domain-containing protein [Undibacterium sp.]|uniref:bifunctional diguanylate cyclase/phosphodiesterase n=1 Tax=Undibacterium sp. TaxID=1914977 RepID=UPI00374CDC31